MSEIPNAVKGAAREKMREAKERGETLKYTDALASVLDTETVEQSPNTKMVSRLRAALNHLNEAMRDNPCCTDETRRQARTVVTNIVRNSDGKRNQVFPICIRGYKNTAQYKVRMAIYGSLVVAGVVPEKKLSQYSSEAIDENENKVGSIIDYRREGFPSGIVANDFESYAYDNILRNLRYEAYLRGDAPLCDHNIVLFLSAGNSKSFDDVYNYARNRVNTHIPIKKGDTAEVLANEAGYTMTSNAVEEFEAAMDEIQRVNDKDFYDDVSWMKVTEYIVDHAIDVHLDKLVAKDTCDFDTNIYAEDINQAAKDTFFVDYGTAIPDENPSPTILTAAWERPSAYYGSSVPVWTTGDDWTPEWNWKNRRRTTVPLGVAPDKPNSHRSIPSHHCVRQSPYVSGTICGRQGSGYTIQARNFVISAAAQYSPEDLNFVVFNGKEHGLIQVDNPKIGVSRLSHVIEEFDNEDELQSWIRHQTVALTEAREAKHNVPHLCVVLVGEISDKTKSLVSTEYDGMTFLRVSEVKDFEFGWTVHVEGHGTGIAYLETACSTNPDVFFMFGDEGVSELIDRICDYHESLKQE